MYSCASAHCFWLRGGGGGGGVLFAGRPSGSSASRSFSRGFLGVCVSLSLVYKTTYYGDQSLIQFDST